MMKVFVLGLCLLGLVGANPWALKNGHHHPQRGISNDDHYDEDIHYPSEEHYSDGHYYDKDYDYKEHCDCYKKPKKVKVKKVKKIIYELKHVKMLKPKLIIEKKVEPVKLYLPYYAKGKAEEVDTYGGVPGPLDSSAFSSSPARSYAYNSETMNFVQHSKSDDKSPEHDSYDRN